MKGSSKPEVGSSKINMSGFATNSNPILTLLPSPPLIPLPLPLLPPILTPAILSIPNCSITSSTLACFCESGMDSGSRNLAANNNASRTVNCGGRMSCCGTNPTRLPAPPEKDTLPDPFPDLAFPANISTRLVLPAPEGPRMAIISPGRTVPVRESNIVWSSSISTTPFPFLLKRLWRREAEGMM